MYPVYMEESICKVEVTRERRLKEAFPRITSEGKTALLQDYHTDFIKEVMRELQLGTNKGNCNSL
jgi:hypothetical protein